MRPTLRFFAIIPLVLLLIAPSAGAAYDVGKVCVAPNDQVSPAIATDNAGGAFITWQDARNGSDHDIYAQRVDPTGLPVWTVNGIGVAILPLIESTPAIVADGAGGAIIAFCNNDNPFIAHEDIYVQRVDASGAVLWTAGGVAVCTAIQRQLNPVLVSDGTGGAFVAWRDSRAGELTNDIYVQRVDASGVPQWTPDGVAVCTAANNQFGLGMTLDGAGGAILSWADGRIDSDINIYAQRVDALGATQWTGDGVALCAAGLHQLNPVIISDGAGGAIVAWDDSRDGTYQLPAEDIFAQRVDAFGAVQWTADGVPVASLAKNQKEPVILPDGAGGAIISWSDSRDSAINKLGIYAQRVDASGTGQWTANGVAVCSYAGNKSQLKIASDGAGGAIVTWLDRRYTVGQQSQMDIFAGRVTSSGVRPWSLNGVAVCTAPNAQASPCIVAKADGVLVAWQDFRSGTTNDIYTLPVSAQGVVPTGVGDTPLVPAGVLATNYPNPFAAETNITVSLANDANVNIDVFDVAGRSVRTVRLGQMAAGSMDIKFDGIGNDGRPLASGVYFCRVHAAGQVATRKIVITR